MSTTIDIRLSENRRSAEERQRLLDTPGFGQVFTDHMITIRWTEEDAWHDAKLEPYGPLTLDPATAVFHYAQEIFEGLKAYRHDDSSIWAFRPEANAERMLRSSRRLALPELPAKDIIQAIEELVRVDRRWAPERSGEKSLYVRPFMIATDRFLGVRPAEHVTFMVIASPAGAYFKRGPMPVSLWLTTDYT